MKLDLFRTIKIGCAFLAICAFWQMYNNVIPLILTDTFHLNESVSGVIMAADNILALILLPLFGTISDRTKTSLGRRKPYIVAGSFMAALLLLFIPFFDNLYYKTGNGMVKAGFIVVLGLILIVMGVYRSPAVALMPDLTPKRLRSEANAVINLMGAVGGILYLILAALLYSKKRIEGLAHVDYTLLFLIIAVIMVLSAIVIMVGVDEVKLGREKEEAERQMTGPVEETSEPEEIDRADDAIRAIRSGSPYYDTDPRVRRSMLFLLISIALWFMSYNAVETWITTYAGHEWGLGLGEASLIVTVATASAIVSYGPVGYISGKIGRKNNILLGVVMLASSFAILFIYSVMADHFSKALYAVFALIGFAWASINVNSLPMVLEMCKDEDIGKFTGNYYFFSMFAQILTPILAGFCLNKVGYWTLFLYSTLFALLAAVTMMKVKHGDVNEK